MTFSSLTNPESTAPTLLEHATRVANPLRNTFSELFLQLAESQGDAPGRSARNPRVSLRLHPTLKSRLSRSLRMENPLAVLYHMPGSDGLRRVLDAAKKAGCDARLLRQCEQSVRQYEQFLDDEDISKDSLHALLGGFLPEARDAMLRASGQAAFKANRNLIGYSADIAVSFRFIYPGTDDNHCNIVLGQGLNRWRRLREDACCLAHSYGIRGEKNDERMVRTTLDGEPLSKAQRLPLLEPFCTNPLPHEFRRSVLADRHYYTIVGREVGVRSTASFYFAEIVRDAEPRYRSDELDFVLESNIINTPCKHVIFDTFVHKDVWPNVSPTLECFRTVPHGIVTEINYQSRQFDVIDLGQSVRMLAPGLTGIEVAALNRYREMIDFVISKAGLRAIDFRGYRCESPYPMYGSQTVLRFDLPQKPTV